MHYLAFITYIAVICCNFFFLDKNCGFGYSAIFALCGVALPILNLRKFTFHERENVVFFTGLISIITSFFIYMDYDHMDESFFCEVAICHYDEILRE